MHIIPIKQPFPSLSHTLDRTENDPLKWVQTEEPTEQHNLLAIKEVENHAVLVQQDNPQSGRPEEEWQELRSFNYITDRIL